MTTALGIDSRRTDCRVLAIAKHDPVQACLDLPGRTDWHDAIGLRPAGRRRRHPGIRQAAFDLRQEAILPATKDRALHIGR